METFNLKGGVLEFDNDTHTYIYNGIIVPSVTQLLKKKFSGMYDGISKGVLEKAAQRGTDIHKAIEDYCVSGIETPMRELHDFKFLMNYYKFEVIENEKPIVLDLDGTYAGRFDMIVRFNDKLALCDIKTTSKLDKEYLAHQLNLYRIGAKQSYGYDIEELYGIHLRNGTRKLVKIPIVDEERLKESLNGV